MSQFEGIKDRQFRSFVESTLRPGESLRETISINDYKSFTYRKDATISGRVIWGFSIPGSSTDEAKWLIYTVDSDATAEALIYAISGGETITTFTLVWDDRKTYFQDPPEVFASGFSLLFDGVDEYIQATDNNSLDITDDLTVSVWVRMAVGSSSGISTIAGKWNENGGERSYAIQISNGQPRIILSETGSSTVTFLDTTQLTEGVWHHLAATVRSVDQTLIFYIDSVETSTFATAISGIHPGTSTFHVGMNRSTNGAPVNFFHGHVDEVSIWNETLTAQKISEIYNDGQPADLRTHSDFPNCVLWYRMGDNDIFPTIIDRALSNDASMINMEESDIRLESPAV